MILCNNDTFNMCTEDLQQPQPKRKALYHSQNS